MGKGSVKLQNLYETVENFRVLTTFFEALEAADLLDLLTDEGPYTLFAPSNEAFQRLPEGVWDELLEPENEDKLFEVLSYHIVPEKLFTKNLVNKKLATFGGSIAKCHVEGNKVFFEEAPLIEKDVDCSNGVIHIIDEVILPE